MKRLVSGDQQVGTLKYLSRLMGYYLYENTIFTESLPIWKVEAKKISTQLMHFT